MAPRQGSRLANHSRNFCLGIAFLTATCSIESTPCTTIRFLARSTPIRVILSMTFPFSDGLPAPTIVAYRYATGWGKSFLIRSSYGGNEVAEAFGDACHKLVTAR